MTGDSFTSSAGEDSFGSLDVDLTGSSSETHLPSLPGTGSVAVSTQDRRPNVVSTTTATDTDTDQDTAKPAGTATETATETATGLLAGLSGRSRIEYPSTLSFVDSSCDSPQR